MNTLLIADDSPGKIELMKMMLVRFKWKGKVIIAHNGTEAANILNTDTITHAFVDFYIPPANGPAIIKDIKQRYPQAHIALVSSADNTKNFEQALAAGAETCICTTYRSDEVERMFGEVIGGWIGETR